MLRVNVGLSRKLTANFNSTGFTLNLEGEVNAPLNDPDAVIERIKEYYDLADEALRQQVQRHGGDPGDAVAVEPQVVTARLSRPAEVPPPPPPEPPTLAATRQRPASVNGQPRTGPADDAATPNQIRFIQSLAKKQHLSSAQLDAAVTNALGQPCSLHQLTKKQAGRVIDTLNQNAGEGR